MRHAIPLISFVRQSIYYNIAILVNEQLYSSNGYCIVDHAAQRLKTIGQEAPRLASYEFMYFFYFSSRIRKRTPLRKSDEKRPKKSGVGHHMHKAAGCRFVRENQIADHDPTILFAFFYR